MISDQIIVFQAGELYDYGAPQNVITPKMLRDVFKVDAEIDISSKNESISVYNFQLFNE